MGILTLILPGVVLVMFAYMMMLLWEGRIKGTMFILPVGLFFVNNFLIALGY